MIIVITVLIKLSVKCVSYEHTNKVLNTSTSQYSTPDCVRDVVEGDVERIL